MDNETDKQPEDTDGTGTPLEEMEPDAKLLISFYKDEKMGFEAAYSAVNLDVYKEDDTGQKKLDKDKLIPLFESLLEEIKAS